MILIDENRLTNGCIELIANCYEIEVVYVDGLMILNNRVFARYDGHSDDEFRDPYDYYVLNEVKR